MLSFVRVFAGADPEFETHLKGVLELYMKAFGFYAAYANQIESYARGAHPEGAEAIILAARRAERTLAFTVAFYFRIFEQVISII